MEWYLFYKEHILWTYTFVSILFSFHEHLCSLFSLLFSKAFNHFGGENTHIHWLTSTQKRRDASLHDHRYGVILGTECNRFFHSHYVMNCELVADANPHIHTCVHCPVLSSGMNSLPVIFFSFVCLLCLISVPAVISDGHRFVCVPKSLIWCTWIKDMQSSLTTASPRDQTTWSVINTIKVIVNHVVFWLTPSPVFVCVGLIP